MPGSRRDNLPGGIASGPAALAKDPALSLPFSPAPVKGRHWTRYEIDHYERVSISAGIPDESGSTTRPSPPASGSTSSEHSRSSSRT